VITFDPARIKAQIDDLEREMASPGFWEERGHAAEASRRLEQNRALLSRYRALSEEMEEVEILQKIGIGKET